jgi:hypothetical protein
MVVWVYSRESRSLPGFYEQDPRAPSGVGGLFVRPAGRTHLEVKILYTPDTGEVLAEGKGSSGDWGF